MQPARGVREETEKKKHEQSPKNVVTVQVYQLLYRAVKIKVKAIGSCLERSWTVSSALQVQSRILSMSLLWVWGALPFTGAARGGGRSNSSGDRWYHFLLLQGGPGSFRQKGMNIPRVRKRRSSSPPPSPLSHRLEFFFCIQHLSDTRICRRISWPCRGTSDLRSRSPPTVEETRSASSPDAIPSFGM